MGRSRKNFILKSTYQILREEAEEIQHKLTKEIPQYLKQAYDTGGYWHDNPHWDYTLLDQQRLSEQLSEILSIISDPVFIEDLSVNCDKVTLGTQVEVRNIETGEIEVYRIVGSVDVLYNPQRKEKRFISWESPLGHSLLGKLVGDEITVNLPNGIKQLIILAIKPLWP